MIPPFDAWAIGRLLTGATLNGELARVSPPYRRIADRLAGLPPADRQSAFGEALQLASDAGGIIEAVAGADPSGPPPDPEADGPDEPWPPLRLGEIPEAAPFPIDVLPPPVARLVTAGAEAIGCPPDYLAAFALAVAGGAIGRSVNLRLKEGYFAHPTTFIVGIGPPSDGKTPALKAVAAAVRRIDADLDTEHARALELWREEAAKPVQGGKKPPPPPAPKPRRIDVDDITVENIPILLADNPRGLIMVRDELAALVQGLNQYKGGKGNDRSIILKIWAGESIKRDRVGNEGNVPIRCVHPTLTIFGGLPPDMLGDLLDPKGRADGFLDRFLLTYPEPRPVPDWSERGVPEDIAEEWCEIVRRLWQRPMNIKDGKNIPFVAHFSPEGKARWLVNYNQHAQEMRGDDFPATMRGVWGKLREYAGRLALILACLGHAADPTADPDAVPEVGPRTVDDAWQLVAYFKAHARRVHAVIARGPGFGDGAAVKAIVEWIRAGDVRSFSERDIKQARKWIGPENLADALKSLARRNAIRPFPAPPGNPKGGRPSSPAFDVNPELFATQKPQNPRNFGVDDGEAPPFEGFEGFEGGEGGGR